MAAVSFRAEDRVFVDIAIEESRRLNLQKHAPTSLIWSSKLPADQPILHGSYILMPEVLNGKITPQDARPLIMSAIVQKELVKRRNPPDRYFALLTFFSFFGLIGSLIVSILINNGHPSEPLGSAIILAWLTFTFFGAGFLRLRNNRMQRLQADLQVAQLIGSDIFSQTLRRIESLNLIDEQRKLRSLLSGWPTLSQRILNLNQSRPTIKKDAFEPFQKKWGLGTKS